MPGAIGIGVGVSWCARAAPLPPRTTSRANREEIRRRMRMLLSGERERSGRDARFDEGQHVVQFGKMGTDERADGFGLGEGEFVVEADGDAVVDFVPGDDLVWFELTARDIRDR